MNDEYLTLDEIAARRRETRVLLALRRLQHARPELGDPFALLTAAQRAWRSIPTDDIAAAVDAALSVTRGPLTLADVQRAWRKQARRRARRPTLAVRMQEAARALARRNAAAVVPAEPADPQFHRAFCRQMIDQFPEH